MRELLTHFPGPLLSHVESLRTAREVTGMDDEAGQKVSVALVFHYSFRVISDFRNGLFEFLENGEVLFHVCGHDTSNHYLSDQNKGFFRHILEYVAVLLKNNLKGLVDMVLFQDTFIMVFDG